jgi:hypothetical protein
MKLDQQACGIVIFTDCGTSRVRAGRIVKAMQRAAYEKGHVYDYRGVWRLVDGKSLSLQLIWWGTPTPVEFFESAASSSGWGMCQVIEPGDGSNFL